MKRSNDNADTKKYLQLNRLCTEPIGLVIAAFVCLSITLKGATYYAVTDGRYQDRHCWIATYPGNFIRYQDTVYIDAHIELSTDLVVNGIVVIGKNFSLKGTHQVVLLDNGALINHGTISVKVLVNKGKIVNQHLLETENDFINSGVLQNQRYIHVGKTFDNTGKVIGQKGSIVANQRWICRSSGSIEGTLEICSDQVMLEDETRIEQNGLTYCGMNVFSRQYLTASVSCDKTLLVWHHPQGTFVDYQIVTSDDGIRYTPLLTLQAHQVTIDKQGNLIFNLPPLQREVWQYVKVIAKDHQGANYTCAPVVIGPPREHRQLSLLEKSD